MTLLLAALVGLVLHEAAHAWMADVSGDPLPRFMGRITLNPLAHLDPLWSLLVPGALLFVGLPPVGKGRTVELMVPSVEVFMAGPLANVLLAVLLVPFWPEGAMVNVVLAGFNLLPLPGFDGGETIALIWRMAR